MEWWPFLIFHRGGLRIKVINNTHPRQNEHVDAELIGPVEMAVEDLGVITAVEPQLARADGTVSTRWLRVPIVWV